MHRFVVVSNQNHTATTVIYYFATLLLTLNVVKQSELAMFQATLRFDVDSSRVDRASRGFKVASRRSSSTELQRAQPSLPLLVPRVGPHVAPSSWRRRTTGTTGARWGWAVLGPVPAAAALEALI